MEGVQICLLGGKDSDQTRAKNFARAKFLARAKFFFSEIILGRT